MATLEQRVLNLLRGLVREIGHERALRAVSVDARLDRDLGLDSLARMELLHRIEAAFRVRLPDLAMAEARTVQDIIQAVSEAEGKERHVISRPEAPAAPLPESTLGPPESAATLIEVLLRHAEAQPDRVHLYLRREDEEEHPITYSDLLQEGLRVANGLRRQGVGHGETVALMLPTSAGFFHAYFGILLAGGIPVPIYPPFRPDRMEEYARRQSHILKNAGVRILITFRRVEALARILRSRVPTLTAVTGVSELSQSGGQWVPDIGGDDLALVQYTSGSTGDPRGVALTHQNLLANIRAAGQALAIRPTDVGVSWLPLYHDMGLIGAWLGTLYHGIPLVILPPESFLARPERWLWAIHYRRGTLSAAPNFAYELCVRRISDEALEGLDLGSWRAALNGAEPVSPDTLARFGKRFAPSGFRMESFLPVYGLAESALAVAFPPAGRAPRVDAVARRAAPGESRRMAPAPPSDPSPLRFVSCGVPLPGHEVRIVDEDGKVLDERMEGRLHFRGPSTLREYYRNPEATAAVFHGEWVDSGDTAYRADGEIFITGRTKDTIIKGGRNIYPQEVEELTGELPGVRKGCVAAFGVPDEATGTEQLIVAAETRETGEVERDRIVARVVDRLAAQLGTPPDAVSLVAPGTIPKTSSGKICRSACRELYMKGGIAVRRPSIQVQVTRLFLQDLRFRIPQAVSRFREFMYGLWVWGLLGLTIVPVFTSVVLSRDPVGARGLSQKWAKRFLRWAGVPVRVTGAEHLLRRSVRPELVEARGEHSRTGRTAPLGDASEIGPFVLVSNHASYIDALVLLAGLPNDFVFVAKEELIRAPLIRTFVQRGGHLTVDRRDMSRGVTAIERMRETLKLGLSVLIFPEGTTTRATGLRPFTLGAFKAAVESSTPVVPIALQGTRRILRPESWMPKRGSVEVTIGPPLTPEGKDWGEILRLRDLSRAEIARHCGEPSLDIVLAGLPAEEEKLSGND